MTADDMLLDGPEHRPYDIGGTLSQRLLRAENQRLRQALYEISRDGDRIARYIAQDALRRKTA
jgi:hypothetical protein